MADEKWQAPWAQLRILVVDDHTPMRRAIRNMLFQFGSMQVHEAEDGVEAWLKLQEQEYDFIVADWNMPKMSGSELLKNVRALSKHKEIPFLMVTGEADQGKAAEAGEREVDGYILKPFTASDLRARIERILRWYNQPSELEASLRRGDECRDNADLDGALNEYAQALKIRPGNAKVLHRMGKIYHQKGDIPKALEYYDQAMKGNPLYLKALDDLGELYAQQTMWDQAVQALARGVEISPNNTARRIRLGEIYLEKGDINSARKHFKKATNQEPDNAEVWHGVADAFFQHELFAEAGDVLRFLQERFPEDVHTLNRLGIILCKQGKFQEALDVYREAIAIRPNDDTLYCSLAMTHLKVGDRLHAIQYLEKALEINSNSILARESLKRISSETG